VEIEIENCGSETDVNAADEPARAEDDSALDEKGSNDEVKMAKDDLVSEKTMEDMVLELCKSSCVLENSPEDVFGVVELCTPELTGPDDSVLVDKMKLENSTLDIGDDCKAKEAELDMIEGNELGNAEKKAFDEATRLDIGKLENPLDCISELGKTTLDVNPALDGMREASLELGNMLDISACDELAKIEEKGAMLDAIVLLDASWLVERLACELINGTTEEVELIIVG
jgi:hypothetical protein